LSNKDRILAISKKLDLSHIGSNLSCLPVLEEIYAKKKPDDIVILDNAHAHLAHLVVKTQDSYDEHTTDYIIEESIEKFGIHCDRKAGCDASGGSLGHGLGIGIGYALADRKRDVYVVVSEGSMMEGSSWEALRLTDELKIDNLYIYSNFNGYTAVGKVNPHFLEEKMKAFVSDDYLIFNRTENGAGYEGVAGHYIKAL
jgi:transketolase